MTEFSLDKLSVFFRELFRRKDNERHNDDNYRKINIHCRYFDVKRIVFTFSIEMCIIFSTWRENEDILRQFAMSDQRKQIAENLNILKLFFFPKNKNRTAAISDSSILIAYLSSLHTEFSESPCKSFWRLFTMKKAPRIARYWIPKFWFDCTGFSIESQIKPSFKHKKSLNVTWGNLSQFLCNFEIFKIFHNTISVKNNVEKTWHFSIFKAKRIKLKSINFIGMWGNTKFLYGSWKRNVTLLSA